MKHVKLFEQFILEATNIAPIVSKTIEAISMVGTQSARWEVKLQHAPADAKNLIESLKERDEDLEQKDQANTNKMIAKCDTLIDQMSPEMLALYSFAKEDFGPKMNAFGKAGMALQGIKEACKDYESGCNEVKNYKKTYDTAFSDFKNAEAQLRELAKKANVRV